MDRNEEEEGKLLQDELAIQLHKPQFRYLKRTDVNPKYNK